MRRNNASFIRLKPQQLGGLCPLLQPMLAWIREHDAEAGDSFHNSALNVDLDEVHETLSMVLSKGVDALQGEALREVLASKPTPVWSRAAYELFMSSSPRVVDVSTCDELLAAVDGMDEDTPKDAFAAAVKPLLGRMPEANLCALQELCEIIHESSMDPEITAMSMAQSILLDADAPAPACGKAKSLFALLVQHKDAVFPRSRAPSAAPPGMAASAPAPPSAPISAEEKRLRDALREFLEWRDKPSAKLVDQLFEYYEFKGIAQGVQNKYGGLPPAFVDLLEDLVADNTPGLEWFDKKQKATKKRFSLLPRINRKPLSPAVAARSQVDRIIDEIVTTEATYHDTMRDLFDYYVSAISDIAEGRRGHQARSELGLDAGDVEAIFGSRLRNVLEVSDDLLARLDLVSLVPEAPRAPATRPGIVAAIFADHAQNLRVYAPYISSHMGVVKRLKRALVSVDKAEKLKASSSARKLLGAEKRQQRSTFVKLWFDLSAKSPRLKNHTLESILIMPVQRVPRYKLLLETLLKELPKIDPAHPALPAIEEARHSVMAAARQINTAVQQHSKLESIFGKDMMISPNNSIVRTDAEGNFQAIVNSYVG